MTTEAVQKGVASDGHGTVLWVPAIADLTKPTIAELTAETVIALTYGLATDGFDHQTNITKITTGRYTLDQALKLDGKIEDTVTLKWVYNRTTPTAVETSLGTPGTAGNIVKILGYENGFTISETTKINAIIPVETSIPIDVPPTENTELMKQMELNVTGKVRREHEITVQTTAG